MRLYFIDVSAAENPKKPQGGFWFNTMPEAKIAARDAADALKVEVRVSTMWITTDRASMLKLLNGGAAPVRRHSIQFIARPGP
jgi:hypothetical protein